MKLVFDFTVIEHVRPIDNEDCLFILKNRCSAVLMGNYDQDNDCFHVDDLKRYSADDVLYWVSNAVRT